MTTPCECGHGIEEHAEFIDHQTSSSNNKPERRHCMNGFGTPKRCECYKYRPVIHAEFDAEPVAKKKATDAVRKDVVAPAPVPCVRCPNCGVKLVVSLSELRG